MSMIERVGRALAKEEGYAYDPYPYDVRARFAIEAMRELTDAMVRAYPDDVEDISLPQLQRLWSAMIDAALAGECSAADPADDQPAGEFGPSQDIGEPWPPL